MGGEQRDYIVLGRISGLYGVRGWVKLFSETEPRENIVNYDPWYLRLERGWTEVRVRDGRRHGKSVIAAIEGIEDRDAAARYLDVEVAVRRDQLEELDDGEYYWSDLVGLSVVNREGVGFGVVDHLIETGANDVLVVKGDRERLIPYTDDAVLEVDASAGRILVEWDPEF